MLAGNVALVNVPPVKVATMYTVSVVSASGRVRSTQADTLADVVALTIGLVVPFSVVDADGVEVPTKRIAHNRRAWLSRMVKRTGLSRAMLTLSDMEFWRMVARPNHYVHDAYDRHDAHDDIIEYARAIGGAELVEQVTRDPIYQMLDDTPSAGFDQFDILKARGYNWAN